MITKKLTTRSSTSGMSQPTFTPRPQCITALWLALISRHCCTGEEAKFKTLPENGGVGVIDNSKVCVQLPISYISCKCDTAHICCWLHVLWRCCCWAPTVQQSIEVLMLRCTAANPQQQQCGKWMMGQTDGQTPDCYIDPDQPTMWAVSIRLNMVLCVLLRQLWWLQSAHTLQCTCAQPQCHENASSRQLAPLGLAASSQSQSILQKTQGVDGNCEAWEVGLWTLM